MKCKWTLENCWTPSREDLRILIRGPAPTRSVLNCLRAGDLIRAHEGRKENKVCFLNPNVLDLNFTINFTVRRGRSRSFVKVFQSYCSLTLLCFYRETQWEPVDLNFSRCQRLFMGGFRSRSSLTRAWLQLLQVVARHCGLVVYMAFSHEVRALQPRPKPKHPAACEKGASVI